MKHSISERLLALAMAVVLCVGMLPARAMAVEEPVQANPYENVAVSAEGKIVPGSTVTLSTTAEVADTVYQYSVDGGKTWTDVSGNSFRVPESASAGDALSLRAANGTHSSRILTASVSAGETTVMAESAVADAAKVVLYYPNGAMALTGTANGNKLNGVEATVTDGHLTSLPTAEEMTVGVTAAAVEEEVVYTYTFQNG